MRSLALCGVALAALTGSACPRPDAPEPRPRTVAAIEGLPPPMARGDEFARGVSLGLFVSDRDPKAQDRIYAELLDEIREIGATDVQIVVRWAQRDVLATEIAPDPAVSTDDARVESAIRAAHARGLRVFLFPILHLNERKGREWRGTLEPKDEALWWRSYRSFITHYAKLAAANEVELLSIGSELLSLERREVEWRGLIHSVRETYSGTITYSANWDHFEPVPFWDAVDVVGVTAYQPLSAQPNPDESALALGFRPFLGRLRSWAARSGHRYLITEIGFPAHDLAASRPWDHRARGQPNVELQLRCYRAMYRVFQDDPRLWGVFVWNWFGFGGPNDASYTPRGKPAAEVLRLWYRSSKSDGSLGRRKP